MQTGQTIDMFNDPAPVRDGDLPEYNPAPVAPLALAGTRITDIHSRTDLIRELTSKIPVNEYGLPKWVYRPDLLDHTLLVKSLERGAATFVDEMLQAAQVFLQYTQGFPTIQGETPYWGRLPFETEDAHAAFLAYCDQGGVRNLHSPTLTAWPNESRTEWFHLNYWFSRARALDQFRVAHHQRLRERRIMDLEDDHYIKGQEIYKKIVKAIDNKDQAKFDEMDVDRLIHALERVSRLQRQAVGLSPTGGNENQVKSSSVEVIMRESAEDNRPKELESDTFDITLLNDPEITRQAQELIIKVTR